MESRIAYRNVVTVCSVVALALLVAPKLGPATEIEKWLIMPGPVVSSHAEFEADCAACHAPLSEQSQDRLCIACHVDIGADIDRRKGFHGRLSGPDRRECESCHTEHEGRDFDIVALDEASFDHALTDFVLQGAHTTTSCDGCHADGKLHREAPTECAGCHSMDDVHAGSLGDDCGACHNETTWTEATFDHRSTRFPLTGAHAVVSCDSCHRSKDFAEVGQTCNDCHSQDDVHKGRNGTQCVDCHSTTTWTKLTFNHMVVSGFALVGGHKGLDCQSCHRTDDFSVAGGSDCNSCHQPDDPHEGRFGADCGSCHNTFNWESVLFDHSAETGFTLPPGHRELDCDACHTESLAVALPSECGTCHAADDVHKGQLGDRCTGCHVSTSWTAPLWFDHDVSSFPLLGVHADLACDQCHATAAFHDVSGACVSCHVDEDPHRGSLGEQCDDCHNPASWRAWQFDHDQQTGFSLTGAHTDLKCSDCHLQSTGHAAVVRDDCNSCHRRDDPHSGRFGNNCETCHTTSSFTEIEGM